MLKAWNLVPNANVRQQFFTTAVLDRISKYADMDFYDGTGTASPEEIREKINDYDIVFTGWGSPRIGKDVLEGGHRLKMLLHTGGTVGPYVDQTTFDEGVKVISANDVYAKSTAEGVLTYILASLRQVPYWDSEVRAGNWHGTYKNYGLFNRKVGLVGLGAITQHLIPLLKPFSVDILVYSSHLSDEDAKALGVRSASLEEIFSTADIVSLHSALTDKNEGMVNRELMELMRPETLFVNAARAGLVEEDALIDLLSQNRFFAALDVYHQEPLATDSPLRSMPNTLLMPHMAGPTTDQYPYAVHLLIDELIRFQNSEALEHEITLERYKRMTANG